MSNVNHKSAKQRISERIKAGKITTRLEEYAMTYPEDPDYDKKVMTAPQVNAAKILLAKVIPDLKQIEGKFEVETEVTKIIQTIVKPEPKDS